MGSVRSNLSRRSRRQGRALLFFDRPGYLGITTPSVANQPGRHFRVPSFGRSYATSSRVRESPGLTLARHRRGRGVTLTRLPDLVSCYFPIAISAPDTSRKVS
jgi:hypothetical protein